ncbi:uncharacterized protein H6S33_010303 [Morchella sextelata]|uniref:uncharacterized protein n=1 Tax=Morchella sextelata TaxID=1174677 RepID=UPI001D036E1C|nr:uncharacterized protein H6S33_010303 [Morchella sextelata]KAH0612251.1 hypothetical protein H6S33_010303 [Morchella sextelata]
MLRLLRPRPLRPNGLLAASRVSVRPISTDSSYVTPLLLDNAPHTTAKTFAVHNPASPSSVLWRASAASLKDVERVTASAAAAFPVWSGKKLVERRDLLFKFADILERRGGELTECMCTETAAQEPWAKFNIFTSVGFVKEVAGKLTSIEGRLPESADEGRTAMVYREPYGVVLAIAPWNAPIILAMRGILFPLAAGNTVIFKSSELSPRTHYLLASMFVEAGLPPGALNVIGSTREDGPEITNSLIAQRDVRKINFTGSTAVGRKIAAKAGEHLKPVMLELGGKAPFIVFEDADVEKAAEAAVFAGYLHAGQICMATENVIVHTSLLDRFSAALSKAARAFPSNQPFVLAGAHAKVSALVASAVQQGATIVDAEHHATSIAANPGTYPNTVLRGVTKDMDIYSTESFGPVVSLIAFETEEEAVALANGTEYGLHSALWSRDIGRALRVARRIEAGAVHINGMTVHDEPHLPHGGRKESGFGRFGGSYGLDEFLATKTVTFMA